MYKQTKTSLKSRTYLWDSKHEKLFSSNLPPYFSKNLRIILNVLSCRSKQKGRLKLTSCLQRKILFSTRYIDAYFSTKKRKTNLFDGTAVHTILWEVPADIWWTGTPSRLMTFTGFRIGLLKFPCPHWPITLLPHAKTFPKIFFFSYITISSVNKIPKLTSQSRVRAKQWESPTDISTTIYWSSSSIWWGIDNVVSDVPHPRAAPLPQAKTCKIFCISHAMSRMVAKS